MVCMTLWFTTNVTSYSCVITPNGQTAFTAAVFSVNADGDAIGSGRLSVYGRPESGEPVTLQMTSSELTSQRAVNLTSLIDVPLASVNFTSAKGADNIRFFMRLQGNVELEDVPQMVRSYMFVCYNCRSHNHKGLTLDQTVA